MSGTRGGSSGGTPGGSDTQVQFNDASAFGGDAGLVYNKTSDTLTVGAGVITNNGAASTPPLTLTGTIFTGGTATTTKPQFLVQPTGATSAAWSTSGTLIGANSASGFIGNLIDLQLNGVSKFKVTSGGNVTTAGSIDASAWIQVGAIQVYYWSGRSAMASPADGVVRITTGAETSFVGLMLGPTGTTFNRIKHDATGVLGIRLADDSAYSGLNLGRLAGSVQSLSGAGAVNLTTYTTALTTTAADALTLADGVAGQIKHIIMVADGGDGTLTPANLFNGTTITFDAIGDSVILQFIGTEWHVISINGATLA